MFREAPTLFRSEELWLCGVVRWATAGKVHRMTPAHRARSLKTEGRRALENGPAYVVLRAFARNEFINNLTFSFLFFTECKIQSLEFRIQLQKSLCINQ